MDIDLADVTLHVDQTLDDGQLKQLEAVFRKREGIVSVHINPHRRHLVLLEYNPKKVHSRDLVDILRYQGLHGELIGL